MPRVLMDENSQTFFQTYIEHNTWNKLTALNLMSRLGLIQDVGPGVKTVTTPKWKKMKPGQITVGTKDAPINQPGFETSSTTLIELATKVVLDVEDVETYENSRAGLHRNALGFIAEALNQAMLPFRNQVDQFIYWGDAFKTPLATDDYAGAGTFTGIMNGFTNKGAGPYSVADDDVGSAYEYVETVTAYIRWLKSYGFESDTYYLLSNEVIEHDMQTGNHKIPTYNFTNEYKALFKEGLIDEGLVPIFSVNNTDESAHNRIAMFVPYKFQQDGKPFGQTFRLVTSRNFKLYPQFGGGTNGNNQYEWIIGWSGAIEELEPTACIRSGNLST